MPTVPQTVGPADGSNPAPATNVKSLANHSELSICVVPAKAGTHLSPAAFGRLFYCLFAGGWSAFHCIAVRTRPSTEG